MGIEKNAQNIRFHGDQYVAMATKKQVFEDQKHSQSSNIPYISIKTWWGGRGWA